MSTESIVIRYFEALCGQDGGAMRALFAEDGVIDDYVGRHHVGGAAIEAFINQVVKRKLRIVSEIVQEGQRATAVAEIAYADGRVTLVRWIFQIADGKIAHVGNTAVKQFPEAWKRSAALEMQSA